MSILVTKKAPDFTAAAVNPKGDIINPFTLSQAIEGKYAVLFFYPLDFTFVCPSELIALDNRIAEFQKRKAEVISVSVDSQFTHLAWRKTPRDQGGIGPVQFTMVSDLSHEIMKAYHAQHPAMGVALRAAYVIDPNGVVRAQIVYDLPIGRHIDELLRVIDAIQYHSDHGDVCPANWRQGQTAMKPTAEGVAHFLKAQQDKL